jgi:hypothetical protein
MFATGVPDLLGSLNPLEIFVLRKLRINKASFYIPELEYFSENP